jgi:hypothetical protein
MTPIRLSSYLLIDGRPLSHKLYQIKSITFAYHLLFPLLRTRLIHKSALGFLSQVQGKA